MRTLSSRRRPLATPAASNTLAELTAAEQRHQEAAHPLLCRRDEIRDALFEAERAKRELERTCSDEDLKAELIIAATLPSNLRSRSSALEQTIVERSQRAAGLREAAHELLNPREVSTRDETAARAQAAELNRGAEHNDSQIPDLKKQLANVRDQITASKQLEANLRNRLLVP